MSIANGSKNVDFSTIIKIPDVAATQAFGHRLAALLFPGAVVALEGPLGDGNTHLVRAASEGLGVPDNRVVTSPTKPRFGRDLNPLLCCEWHHEALRCRW
jgi:hypothetical protein